MGAIDQLSEHARQQAKKPTDYKPDDLELDDDEPEASEDFEENDDGSVTTYEGDESSVKGKVEFDGNLAELIEPNERIAIGQELLELIEVDAEQRAPLDKKYAEGIRRSGLSDESVSGSPFEGSSVVMHPILTECAVDFESSAMKEIMPPQGPVRTKIMGTVSPEKRQKAERKRDYMNWQLTDQIEEYYSEMESLLMQLPFAGSQYLHLFQDKALGRPSVELITADRVILPAGAGNFYMAERMAVRMPYSFAEVCDYINSGEWVDIQAIAPSQMPMKSKTQESLDRVEGVDDMGYNEDGIQAYYRVFVWREFDWDPATEGERAPYVLVIDSDTGDVASIRRNWEEKDKLRKKLDHIAEFKFFPWKGPYGIGMTHMIGGLSAALTGALRALLDTAHINNFPALLKLKSKTGGQTVTLEATGITEIEGSSPVDDVRKLIMPIPYNPPSMTLFQLLGWLDTAAKGVVSTAEEKIADATNNGPVGTTLAMIEQGSKVYANIHARLHRSVKKSLLILHRLNKVYLADKQVVEELGDTVVYRKDFDGPMDVIPVSDPHIFSESQRYAQLQAVRTIRQQEPDLFNRKALVRRELQQLRVENPDELLTPDPKPVKANAVAENMMMAKGRPAAAYPEQDHLSHMKVLIKFMQDKNLGSSPLIAQKFMPLAMQHLADHLVMWYGMNMYAAMNKEIGPEFQSYLKMDKVAPKIDKIISMVIDDAQRQMDDQIKDIPQVVQQAMQLVQQYQQPTDPNVMEVKRKEKRDQMENQLKTQKFGLDTKRTDLKHQVDMGRVQTSQTEIQQKGQEVDARTAAEIRMNALDNRTKVVTDTADNQTKLIIAGHDSLTKHAVANTQAEARQQSSVKNFREGGHVRTDEPEYNDAYSLYDPETHSINLSAIIDMFRPKRQEPLDLGPLVDAIHGHNFDLTPVIDAIRSQPVQRTDFRPVIDAIRESRPNIDLSPIENTIHEQTRTVSEMLGGLSRRINEIQGDVNHLSDGHETLISRTDEMANDIASGKNKKVKIEFKRDPATGKLVAGEATVKEENDE